LNIYIKQEIVALRFGLIERTAGSPVRVAENVRVFKKFVGGDHAFKLIACDEEVFMAVPLASPRRTGWCRKPRKSRPGTNLSNNSTRLDLPDPDGPEMMKTMLISALIALEANFTGGCRGAQESQSQHRPMAQNGGKSSYECPAARQRIFGCPQAATLGSDIEVPPYRYALPACKGQKELLALVPSL
jgi:hypothetical protein